jgi:hypothetical protein
MAGQLISPDRISPLSVSALKGGQQRPDAARELAAKN